MQKEIYFVTGNDYKFQIAADAFVGSGFRLVQKRLDTPEIQSADLAEVAAYSAKWAVEQLDHPLFLTDAGCFIDALNGFPGPFIKYVNEYLSAEDFLSLMQGKENRRVVFKDCIAYCEPQGEPELIFSSAEGQIAKKAGKPGTTPINEVFIPQGFDCPESEVPVEEMVKFWNGSGARYKELIEYLRAR